MTARLHLQPGIFCQAAVGSNADGKNHQVGLQRQATTGVDLKHLILSSLNRLQPIAQVQVDAVHFQVLVHFSSQFEVNRCHDLVEHFHQINLQTQFDQVFGNFQTNKSTADHDSVLWVMSLDPCDDVIQFGDVVQHEDAFLVNPWQWWHNRAGSG